MNWSMSLPFNMSIVSADEAFQHVQDNGFTNDLLIYLPKGITLCRHIGEQSPDFIFTVSGDVIVLPFSIHDHDTLLLRQHGIIASFKLTRAEAANCIFFKTTDKGAASIARFTYRNTLNGLQEHDQPSTKDKINLRLGKPEDNYWLDLYDGHDLSVVCESVLFITLRSGLSGQDVLFHSPMDKSQTAKLSVELKVTSNTWLSKLRAALPSSITLRSMQFKKVNIQYETLVGYTSPDVREDLMATKLKPENIEREFGHRWTDQKTT